MLAVLYDHLEADVGRRVLLQWMKKDIRAALCMAGSLQLKLLGPLCIKHAPAAGHDVILTLFCTVCKPRSGTNANFAHAMPM